jgi:hypothetical protein
VLNAPSNNSNFYNIEKLTNLTSLVTGFTQENGLKTGVVMKVSHQMPPTTSSPTLIAPINGSQYELTPTEFTVTGSFPDTVLAGSINIILTTTDNGGASRAISVTDRQSLNVTFDPLEPDAGISNNSWVSTVTTEIAGAANSTARMPDGTYTVSISYRSTIGGPKATASASSIVFRSKCAPGTFSTTGFMPCTTTGAGSFQNLYGATAAINCQAGTYQPNTRAITCLDAAINHFVPVQGSPVQIPCSTGTHAPGVRATSCISTTPAFNTGANKDIVLRISIRQSDVLRRLKMTVPRGGKVSMTSRTGRVCKVAKARVIATGTGTCRVTVTVTVKKKKTTKTLTLKVT